MTRIAIQNQGKLSGPHIGRCWFADIKFATGRRRLCQADGPVTIGGHVWDGTTDPFGAQLVQVESIPEPIIGQAPIVRMVISGANKQWRRSIFGSAPIRNTLCDLYFATIDNETNAVIVPLTLLYPGRLTAPRYITAGPEIRNIVIGVEHIGVALNYPSPNMDWSSAAQRARYPGDRGLDLMKQGRRETYKS